MSSADAVAFLSYSHEDDEKARGGIVALARLVSDEYSLLTGEDLHLFVDKDIKWGELWRERIENALVATTFLIPVVTPRYFTREECVRELFEFAEQAKGLGVDELICPILYVQVDGLTEDSDDAAKALVATAQYRDWTELRRRGVDAPDHIEAVHDLTLRLVEVAKRVAVRQTAREAEEASGEDVQATLAESISELQRLLGEWREVIEEDAVERESFLGVDAALEKQRAKAEHGPSGGRFIVAMRQVQAYLPMMEKANDLGQQALRVTTQMGPHVTRVMEVVQEHPEERGVLDELWVDLESAADAYIEHDPSKMIAVSKWARQHSHEARGMLELARIAERSERVRKEANMQFWTWRRAQEALTEKLDAASDERVGSAEIQAAGDG